VSRMNNAVASLAPATPSGVGEVAITVSTTVCCAVDGCRSRATPRSLRFLGSKVYIAAILVLIAILRHGVTALRMRELSTPSRAELRGTLATSGAREKSRTHPAVLARAANPPRESSHHRRQTEPPPRPGPQGRRSCRCRGGAGGVVPVPARQRPHGAGAVSRGPRRRPDSAPPPTRPSRR
jgi:hypothetical protein